MTATGPIAWRARSEIPVSWDRLATTTQYGDLTLQMQVDFVKQVLFGTVVAQISETYDPITMAYAGKLIALQVIPAAIDYWSDQAITFNSAARSSSEGVGYPDRIKALQDRYGTIQAEIADLRPILPPGVVTGDAGALRMSRPGISGPLEFRTPDPQTFPRQQGPLGERPFPNPLTLP